MSSLAVVLPKRPPNLHKEFTFSFKITSEQYNSSAAQTPAKLHKGTTFSFKITSEQFRGSAAQNACQTLERLASFEHTFRGYEIHEILDRESKYSQHCYS